MDFFVRCRSRTSCCGGGAWHNYNFNFFIGTDYVFYPLLGYFIDQRLRESDFTRKNLLRAVGLSVAAIALCAVMTHYRCTLLNDWKGSTAEFFFGTTIFLPTAAVFYAAKCWFSWHSVGERTGRWLTMLGGTTFGIYLIEQICRNETRFIFLKLRPLLHSLPACWIWIGAACLLGAVIVLAVKQIPGVKKFI